MMREFLKGDLINSHRFWADGLSNRNTDANNSTVKIHHLEANPLLLASVPDGSSGTGEEKKDSLFFQPLCLVLWKNIFKWQQEPVPLFKAIMPVITTQESVSQLVWITSSGAVLGRNTYKWDQLVHKWLPLLQWSHKFTEDQTTFSSLTNRKKWAKRIEMGQCVMILKTIARQRWITSDKSLTHKHKAFFEASWQDKNIFRSPSVQK